MVQQKIPSFAAQGTVSQQLVQGRWLLLVDFAESCVLWLGTTFTWHSSKNSPHITYFREEIPSPFSSSPSSWHLSRFLRDLLVTPLTSSKFICAQIQVRIRGETCFCARGSQSRSRTIVKIQSKALGDTDFWSQSPTKLPLLLRALAACHLNVLLFRGYPVYISALSPGKLD